MCEEYILFHNFPGDKEISIGQLHIEPWSEEAVVWNRYFPIEAGLQMEVAFIIKMYKQENFLKLKKEIKTVYQKVCPGT